MPPKKPSPAQQTENQTNSEQIDEHVSDEDSLFEEENPIGEPVETQVSQSCPLCQELINGLYKYYLSIYF